LISRGTETGGFSQNPTGRGGKCSCRLRRDSARLGRGNTRAESPLGVQAAAHQPPLARNKPQWAAEAHCSSSVTAFALRGVLRPN